MILRDLGVKEISVARGIKYYLGVIGCNHRTGEGRERRKSECAYLLNVENS